MSIQDGGPGLSRGFLQAIYCLYPTQGEGTPPTGSIATTVMARAARSVHYEDGWFAEARRAPRLRSSAKTDNPVGAGWYRDPSAWDRRAVRVRSRHYLTAPGER